MTTPALFHAAAADSRGKLRVSADRRSVFFRGTIVSSVSYRGSALRT
jgi:hypothetical protein